MILDQFISCGNDSLFLLRYVKPSLVDKNKEPTDDVFQLRESVPPEKYVSFYRFEDMDLNDRFKSFISYFGGENKFKISDNAGVIHIDVKEVCETINATRELIEFKDCRAPHYGMYYLSDIDEDRVEAKTILLFLSKFKLVSDIVPRVYTIKNKINLIGTPNREPILMLDNQTKL